MHVDIEKDLSSDIRRRCLDLVGDDGIELIFLDGFDDAIVGVGEVCGNPPVVVYDGAKIHDILTERFDGDEQAARDFYGHNIAGTFFGSGMPVLLTKLA